MRILYGTGNEAKLAYMREALSGLPVEIVGLADMDAPAPEVEENGRTVLENARLKARAYYAAFRMPVFSCDTSLYLEGFPEEEQPGLYVRRSNGKRLSDEELLSLYIRLAREHGGSLTAWYKSAVCLICGGRVYESDGDELSGEPFRMVDRPHPKRAPGFPLDSLSVEITSGKYYYDLPGDRVAKSAFAGFTAFFADCLRREGQEPSRPRDL